MRKYLRLTTSKVILAHLRVIDGTTILDLRGYSVMPGIVGMHDHLFYMARPNLGADYSSDGPALFHQMTFSAPRLYLANGVTTLRTVGSVDPYTDLRLKQAIEGGILPGPHLDVSGPYLEGTGNNQNLQMHQLTGPEDARATVAYWADRGVTSFKAYNNITRAELRAAIEEAHTRGLKVTGHLCSVTYAEAVELGIDNLEHGFMVNTELDPGKKPNTCSASGGDYTLEHTIPGSPEANRLIALLVGHHVASRPRCRAPPPLCRASTRQPTAGPCGRRCWRRWRHRCARRTSTAAIGPRLSGTSPPCSAARWTSSGRSSPRAGC